MSLSKHIKSQPLRFLPTLLLPVLAIASFGFGIASVEGIMSNGEIFALETEPTVSTKGEISANIALGETTEIEDVVSIDTDIDDYRIYLSGPARLYLNGDASSEYYIASIEDASENSTAWGYRISREFEEYNPIPSEPELVGIGGGSQNFSYYFGAGLARQLPEGSYSGTITYIIEWDEPGPSPEPEVGVFSGITTMQEMTSAICAAETTPLATATEITSIHTPDTSKIPTIQLRDTRDNSTYSVAKLPDGHCWMRENLALGSDSVIELTPDDTNIVSNFTLPASSTTGFSNNSTGFTVAAVNADDKNNTQAASGVSPAGKIGNYYNFCAASGGTYCMASGAGTADAEYDICPKGWKMPTGNSNGEYQGLYTAYGENNARFQANLSTPLSGYFQDGTARNHGTDANFWASTRETTDDMYSLDTKPSRVSTTDHDARYRGISMRCIAK